MQAFYSFILSFFFLTKTSKILKFQSSACKDIKLPTCAEENPNVCRRISTAIIIGFIVKLTFNAVTHLNRWPRNATYATTRTI